MIGATGCCCRKLMIDEWLFRACKATNKSYGLLSYVCSIETRLPRRLRSVAQPTAVAPKGNALEATQPIFRQSRFVRSEVGVSARHGNCRLCVVIPQPPVVGWALPAIPTRLPLVSDVWPIDRKHPLRTN